MMYNNNNISIGTFMVCPVGSTSRFSTGLSSDNALYQRHDFLIFNNMTHLAVALTVVNDSVMTVNPVAVNATLTMKLTDETSGQTVASRNVKVELAADLLTSEIRADLECVSADLDTSHAYRVTVHVNRRHVAAAEHVMHFFRMNELRVLPTKWFSTESGFVRTGHEPLRNPGVTEESEAAVVFNLKCNLPDDVAFRPELGMRVVYPDGKEHTALVNPELWDEENGLWRVVMPFGLRHRCMGVHYAELLCMGHAFAGFLFTTDGATEYGEWTGQHLVRIPEYTPQRGVWHCKIRQSRSAEAVTDSSEVTVTQETQCPQQQLLDSLVGLTNVKRKLTEYTGLMRFYKLRADAGLPVIQFPLHSMFLGSPGTGKTTVAKIMGSLLHKAGVLSKGHVVMRERSSLIGKYYNTEAENIKTALDEAQGGILFIDEAYQLYQPDDTKDPGRFVIESLLTALADESNRDWMLILAGYSEPMMRMFEMNPGLRSRIPDSNLYVFDDFSAEELMEIATRYFDSHRFVLTHEARQALTRVLACDYANRGKDFGNARHVINLIQTRILPNMAMRLSALACPTAGQLSRVESSDIPAPATPVRMSRSTVGFRTLPLVS